MADKRDPARFYVYGLKDPRDGNIFYVGKGSGDRCNDHVRNVRTGREENEKKANRILDILKEGKDVIITILESGLTEGEAFSLEDYHIDLIGFESLTNSAGWSSPLDRQKWRAINLLSRVDFNKIDPEIPMHMKILNELIKMATEGIPQSVQITDITGPDGFRKNLVVYGY